MTDLIYHYTSSQGLLGIINDGINGKMHCSHPLFLNDSKEYFLLLELTKKYLDNFISQEKEPYVSNTLKQCIDMSHSVMTKYLLSDDALIPFFSSFSKEGDLLSQWRGYCPDGGYSLGFEQSLILNDSSKEENWKIDDVEYIDPQQPDIDFTSLLSFFFEQMEKLREEIINIYPQTLKFNLLFESQFSPEAQKRVIEIKSFLSFCIFIPFIAETSKYKDINFKEEKEVRIYILSNENIQYKTIKNSIKPYKILNISLKESLKEIIIGPSKTSELDEIGLKHFLKSIDLSNVEIKHSKIPYRTST